MAPSLRELLASTPLSGGNAPYVEALYEQFLADPQSVEPELARLLPEAADDETAQRAAEQIHSTVQAGIVQRASRPRMAAARPAHAERRMPPPSRARSRAWCRSTPTAAT